MKIEIEISEEDAACLWADHNPTRSGAYSLQNIVTGIVLSEARKYRSAFPRAVPRAVEDFRRVVGGSTSDSEPRHSPSEKLCECAEKHEDR